MKGPQTLKAWFVTGAVGVVAISALGWVGLVGPELSSTSSVKTQTASVQFQNLMLAKKVESLRQQNAKLPALRAQLDAMQAELPADSGLPAYIRQLTAQAAAAHVDLSSLTPGAPGETTISGASVAETPGAAATTSAGPVGSLYSISINLVTAGSLANQQKFLNAIQNNGPRRALVTSTQFTPNGGSNSSTTTGTSITGSTTMTVQLQVFVAPQSPAAEAALKRQLSGKSS